MDSSLSWLDYGVHFLLLFLRLGVVVFLLPFWGGKQFPRSFKIGLALALAYVLTPVVPLPPNRPSLITLILPELLLGMVLGFAARLIFLAVELAGTFISDAMGLSMATVFNPEMGQSTEVSTLLGLLAMLLFLALDFHHDLLALILRSYEALPVGHLRLEHLLPAGIALGGQVFGLALKIAAPVWVAMIVVNVLMGFIYKAAPQVNIFFVSLPVYLLVGCLLLWLSVPFLVHFLGDRVSGVREEMIRILTLVQG